MAPLLKCPKCKTYSLKQECEKCDSKTTSAHYEFPKIRNAPPRSAKKSR